MRTSPSNVQFTGFTSSGSGSVIKVGNGKLDINRTGNGWGFVRGSGFSGPPSSLMVRFDFANVTSGGATTSAIIFGVGGGSTMSSNTTSITNADVHSRLAFNSTSTAGQFVVRDIAGSTNGPSTFTGPQSILLVVNNSGASMSYKAPDGSIENVADDKFDVWVGTSKQLDERNATTIGQTLNYFKCISTSGTQNVTFDNMLIDPIPATPSISAATNVTSTDFTANWSSVSGVTGYRLDVATDANFSSLLAEYSDLYVPGQSTNSINVTGLSSSATYYYRVRGVSKYSVDEFASGNSGVQIVATLNSPSLADFKTSTSGNFSDPSTWVYNTTGTTYANPTNSVPTSSNDVIILHKVNLDQDFIVGTGKSLTLDASLSAADTFNIAAGKTLTVTGSADFSNKQVTLKSSALGTASIGTSTGTIINATSITVERYLPVNTDGGRTGKAWRLLTVPVTGSTIKNGWQEGSLWNGTGTVVSTGYGTLITGLQQGSSGTANGNGFDFWSAISNSTSSIRYHNGSGTGAWNTFSSIVNRKFEDPAAGAYANQGFLVYVRGDRSVSTGTANATVLRATGTLKQGSQSIPVLASGISTYTLIGNPYASPINFESVYNGNASLIQPRFTIWDANLGTTGGYRLVTRTGVNTYTVTPNGGITGSVAQYIQSGQAFFVEAVSGSGNLSIQESYKATSGTDGVLLKNSGNSDEASASATAAIPSISVNLSIRNTDGTVLLADGALVSFDKSYKRLVNGEDVKKASNFAENLSIAIDTFNLISEKRPFRYRDTVFLKIWNTGVKDYRLTIKASAFDGLGKTLVLKDKYLGTSRAVKTDGTNTFYNFSVTSDGASQATDRFYLVIKPIPVTTKTDVISVNSSIKVYPNPVNNGKFTVFLNDLKKGSYAIVVYNNDGQQLVAKKLEHAGGAVNENMIINHQPNGIYSVQLTDAKGNVLESAKLIVKK